MSWLILLLTMSSNIILLNTERPCGRPINTNNPTARIVGGYDLGYYKYPWFASLLIDGEVNCGGTLVGLRVVLTAAHCFKPYINKQPLEDIYKVRLGIYNSCNTHEPNQKEFNVVKVFVHEQYEHKDPYFDISLMVLDKDTSAFLPCCLPPSIILDNNRSREATIQGLGSLKYKGPSPCTLHEARILLYSDADCRKMINSTGNNGSAMQGALCAGYLEGGIDACQGDSGGPLTISNYYGQHILLGITSYGFGCADKNVLGVYTDVSHYLPWIAEKSKAAVQVGGSTNSTAKPPASSNSTHPAVQAINVSAGQRPVHMVIVTGGKIEIDIRGKRRSKNRRPIKGKRKINSLP